jgi:hypothetical protein
MLPLTLRAQESPVGSAGFEPAPQRLKGVYATITPRPRFEGEAAFAAPTCHDSSPVYVVMGYALRRAARKGVEPFLAG